MSDSIIITGVIDLDPAKHDDAVVVLNAAMEATRAEDGCERYVFSADLNDPGRFHVSEQWRDQAANDAHSAGPALATLMGAMGSLGVTGASLTAWTGAEPKKLM